MSASHFEYQTIDEKSIIKKVMVHENTISIFYRDSIPGVEKDAHAHLRYLLPGKDRYDRPFKCIHARDKEHKSLPPHDPIRDGFHHHIAHPGRIENADLEFLLNRLISILTHGSLLPGIVIIGEVDKTSLLDNFKKHPVTPLSEAKTTTISPTTAPATTGPSPLLYELIKKKNLAAIVLSKDEKTREQAAKEFEGVVTTLDTLSKKKTYEGEEKTINKMLAEATFNCGSTFLLLKDTAKSVKYLTRSVTLRQEIFGSANPQYTKAKQRLDDALKSTVAGIPTVSLT